jgi:hypothetical protein
MCEAGILQFKYIGGKKFAKFIPNQVGRDALHGFTHEQFKD